MIDSGAGLDVARGPPRPAGTPTAPSRPAVTALLPSARLVWGILNVTPDSFYDGGRFFDHAAAAAHGFDLAARASDRRRRRVDATGCGATDHR